MSTRLKALLILIAIILFIAATNFFSGLHFTKSALRKTMEKDLEFAIGIADTLLSTKMNQIKAEAIAVAEELGNAGSNEETRRLMEERMRALPHVSSLTLFDRSGAVVVNHSLPPHDHGVNISPKYLEMVYGGATMISSPFYCATQKEYVINVCTPMGGDRILAVTIPGQTFTELLSQYRLWESGTIFMVNEEGRLIGAASPEIDLALKGYSSDTNADLIAHAGEAFRAIDRLLRTILSTDSGVAGYEFEDVEHLCAYNRIEGSPIGWRVVVGIPLNEGPLAGALTGQMYAALLFLLIGAVVAVLLSNRAATPFMKIEAQNRDLESLSEKLRTERDRAMLMLDATPLAARLWSRDFQLVDCNEEAVRLFGLKDKQEYFKRYFEFSPEYQPDGQATAEKIKLMVNEAFASGSRTYDWLYMLTDGTPIPAEVTMVRVPYGDDHVIASYSRDLRAQKKMLAEIERRDTLLRTMNSSAEALLRSEPENFSATLHQCMSRMTRAVNADNMHLFKNYIREGNLRCEKICEVNMDCGDMPNTDGVPSHFLKVRNTSTAPRPDVYAGPDADFAYVETIPEIMEVLLRGECFHSLVRDMPAVDQARLGKRGVRVILLMPIFLQNSFWGFTALDNRHNEERFTDDEVEILQSGSLLIANALLRNDYTQNIQETSSKLDAALADAKDANEAKSNFLAHMSHEIRTPLNAVIGLGELTLEDKSLPPEAASNLEKICGAGSTILSIVNDILDISKIESGKFEIYPARYETPSLINDIVTLNIVRIGEKPIDFRLVVDENLPTALYGDDLRIKRIFNNLLSNAFKYTHAGIVEWRISFEKEGDAAWLVSSVRDTGIGIKPEDMDKLFSDYNQVDMKSNRKIGGTGLGLAITRRLAEMMDGSVTVESEYGKGSTFSVRLRQTLVSGEPIGKVAAENLMHMRYSDSKRDRNAQLVRAKLPDARVLVVDDVVTNLDVVRGMMKPYEMKIDCAMGGRQAVEMIRAEKHRYDAIFMDHMMPEMDGMEATRIIREEIGTEYARSIPIIALTANAIVGTEEMFLKNGFQDFISKPIDMAQLDAVLRRWVKGEA